MEWDMPTLAGAGQVQVVWFHRSGLPKDSVVNTLAFDVSGAGPSSSWMPDLAQLVYDAWTNASGSNGVLTNYYGESLSGFGEIKVYDLGDAEPRNPLILDTEFTPSSSSTPLPAEVALCLSFKTTQGNANGRHRGRIYIGPLGGTAGVAKDSIGNSIPSTGLISAVSDLGKELYDRAEAADMPWSIWSRASNSLGHILATWVDNAFDTQRRRGTNATGRTAVDLTA
jgi:hypothetical protein